MSLVYRRLLELFNYFLMLFGSIKLDDRIKKIEMQDRTCPKEISLGQVG